MPAYLSTSELNDALTIRDLSNPDGGPHAMQSLLQGVIDAFGSKWGVPEWIVRHSPLVSVADNYDRLGFNESDVTRDQKYSR
jgi:phenylalanyl-tRNA synthetase alpha chain